MKARDNLPAGGVISVNISTAMVPPDAPRPSVPPGLYCSIAISDTGPLADRQLMAQVFDPFYTKGEFGTGNLDMAAAYGIITQSAGCLEIISTPETGNSFQILLPLLPPRETD